MAKRILIDAAYPDESRVVVHDGVIQDFDYQTKSKKQIKGNVYLAKVSRIEPSLQAAFIDFGSEKHGFLPFSEINIDYYQIPEEEKLKLKEELRNSLMQHENNQDNEFEDSSYNNSEKKMAFSSIQEVEEDKKPENFLTKLGLLERYKIQDIIKKGQIILVQVVKEERGSKGAFLTTYISLAGKYCVLMPNSNNQGGISRKITENENRQRLKDLIQSLNMSEGSSIIIRTAGSDKPNEEIRNDYNYLVKLWDTIKSQSKNAVAPCFLHAEGDLIKRAVRDLCDDKVEEIIIQGDQSYKEAKDFLQIISSQSQVRIRQYKSKMPIFDRYNIEEEIENLYSNRVYLSSGGYIVINITEALVAIDINSGKATSEKNLETTALKTNIEAAIEIPRQLRLRDLSGLIVIDFIDMHGMENRETVEKILREQLSYDRAKIQIGKISSFGLLEMSRQRLKSSFVEAYAIPCEACNASGYVVSPNTHVVKILRAIENEICKGEFGKIVVRAHQATVVYMLNYKREDIKNLEDRYNLQIVVEIKTDGAQAEYVIEKFIRTAPEDARLHAPSVSISDVAKEALEENINFSESEDEEITGFIGKKNWKTTIKENDVINEAEIAAQIEDISQQKHNNIYKLNKKYQKYSKKHTNYKKKNYKHNPEKIVNLNNRNKKQESKDPKDSLLKGLWKKFCNNI